MPHRAAGWRIEPPVSVPSAHGALPRGHGRRAAAGRAARHAGAVPRVERRAVGGVLVRRAHRELVLVGLAQQRGARLRQPAHDRGGVGRAVALQDPRARLRRHALGAEEVLDRERDAGQRTSVLARLLVGHPQEGVELVGRGAVAVGLEELAAVELAALHGGGRLRGGEGDDVASCRRAGHAEAAVGHVGRLLERRPRAAGRAAARRGAARWGRRRRASSAGRRRDRARRSSRCARGCWTARRRSS